MCNKYGCLLRQRKDDSGALPCCTAHDCTQISGFTKEEYLGGAYAFITTESQNCCETGCIDYRPYAGRVEGFEVAVPAKSFYTITNVALSNDFKV
jgi:hypothetical protein